MDRIFSEIKKYTFNIQFKIDIRKFTKDKNQIYRVELRRLIYFIFVSKR